MIPIPSHQLWERCATVQPRKIETLTMGPPHTCTNFTTEFIADEDLILFGSNLTPSRATSFQKKGAMSSSTHKKSNYTNYASARHLVMARSDTKALSEDVASVSMTSNETVGATRACRVMLRASQQMVCKWCPQPSKIHSSTSLH
ncbi:hypothetical protein TNCV_1600011 [Trichonephila clavipes]|nr:hypothetical protein TNCV_1600011 [Trichonephila clavipes]